MKILLVQNLPYVPSLGGANKATRLLVEALAARGHTCRVLAPWLSGESAGPGHFLGELAKRGIRATFASAEVVVFEKAGVEVHAAANTAHLSTRLARQIGEFEPTWILAASEDPDQILLETALRTSPERVVSVVQTTQMLPFGPESFLASEVRAALFGQVAGIVAISRYLSDYIRRWSGLEASVLPMPVYGPGPFPVLADFERGFVTMVNPCAVKGISIFLALAAARPDLTFAAVPTWGTTEVERSALGRLANVRVLAPVDDIHQLLAQTRVLLAPSLWAETFGYVTVEAMLCGIPVLASDVGGLPEAKLGTDYVLPVRPIEEYEPSPGPLVRPDPIVPPQDIGPWQMALTEVLANRGRYEALSEASRSAALDFVARTGVKTFETYLTDLTPAIPAQAGAQVEPVLDLVAGLSLERRALLAMRLARLRKETPRETIACLPRRGGVNTFALSFAQQRLWFLDQLEPGNAFYNMPGALRLSGQLDREALERAIDAILARHETLRTTFALAGSEPVQKIAPSQSLKVMHQNLEHLPLLEREVRARTYILSEARAPFDLTRGPLLRALLLRLHERDHVLVLTMHHIVSDGWSLGVLIRELAALYRAFLTGQPSPLPALPIQYADFAFWQRGWLQGQVLQAQLAYWKQQLANLPTLALPHNRPRPAVQTFRGAHQPIAFLKSLTNELENLSRGEGATLFMTLLAAFQVLLHRYTGEEKIPIGSPIANRNRSEVEGLIGFFANSLVLCTDLSGDPTFRELLGRAREVTLGAYAHQDLPFEQLVEQIQPQRATNYNPLFQTLFALQNAPMADLTLEGLTFSPLDLSVEVTKFDLECHLWERPEGLRGLLVYSTDLFDAATITRLAGHFETLLTGIVSEPDQRISELPLLTDAEQQALAPAAPGDRDLDELLKAVEALSEEEILAMLGQEAQQVRGQ